MWSVAMFGSTSDRWRALSVAGGAAILVGCTAVVATSGPQRFGHATHVKRGLECAECHATAKTEATAGMPEEKTCADCHDPKADLAELTAAVTAYTSRAPGARHARPASYADVRYDHSKHLAKGLECASCHASLIEGTAAVGAPGMVMATCLDCHQKKGAPSKDCTACHEKIRRDAPPPSHLGLWRLRHGTVSRMAAKLPASYSERCELCHTRSECDMCHSRDAPRDHTNAWRTRMHGHAAAMDRSRCLACHKADSCDRCHDVEPPRSHRGTWGGSTDLHCVSCHVPVAGTSCGVCHKGTPSHDHAPPRPGSHVAAGDCRPCHVAGAFGAHLRHADNGSDCRSCHR